MTAPVPILWLFLHRSGKRGGVLIESVRASDPPLRVRSNGRVYRIVSQDLNDVPTATYIEDPRAMREAAEEVGKCD